MKRKTHEQFVKEVAISNPNIDVLGQYEGSHNRLLVRCKKCGHTYSTKAYVVLQGHGCPACTNHIKHTDESFADKVKALNYNIEVLGKFKNVSTRINVKCRVCGYTWSPIADSLLRGHGCPKCAGMDRKDHQTFVLEMREKNPGVIVVGEYKSNHTKIEVKCKKCGHKWLAQPKNLLRGTGCAICANRIMKTRESFIEELARIHPSMDRGEKMRDTLVEEIGQKNSKIIVLGDYKGAHVKTRVKCATCGEEWFATPNNLLKGYGCANCVLASTSRVERFIVECFKVVFGDSNVIARDKKTIGKELDIIVPHKNIAVEYGAWYWHKNRIEKDIEKRKLCDKKGIRLFIIYDAIGDNQVPFYNDCYTYEKALSINSMATLKGLVTTLLQAGGASNNDIKRINFKEVRNKIISSTGVDKHQDLVLQLKAVNPDVELLGKYIGANEGIRVLCKSCGYIWVARPANLKNGTGCPKCKKRIKYSSEEYIAEVKKKNPDIDLLSKYKSAHNRVKVRCKKCGYEWSPKAASLLRGSGCRKCAGTLKKTQKEFIEELSLVNSKVQIIGDYKTTNRKIEVKCKDCGHEWMATPSSLLRGHGCPRCAGRLRSLCKYDIATGELVKRYVSLTEAARDNNLSPSTISGAVHGKQKTAGGFIWKYEDA